MKRILAVFLIAACATPTSNLGQTYQGLSTADWKVTCEPLTPVCRLVDISDAGTLPSDAGVVGGPDAGVQVPPDAGTQTPDSGTALASWSLTTRGNKIYMPDGTVAKLRGMNTFDPRWCGTSCPYPNDWAAAKDKLRIAAQDWKANFIRLNLEEASTAPQAYFDGLLSTVQYMRTTFPSVYIMVSVWNDSTALYPTPEGGPNAATATLWTRLASLLRDEPNVVFGISNEPRASNSGLTEAQVRDEMVRSLTAIRAAELPGKPHLVAAQGIQGWGRTLNYYIGKELGPNVAYETHPYNGVTANVPTQGNESFYDLLAPASVLPVIIGEFGTGSNMLASDSEAMMVYAERNNIPWLAWSFSWNCPPDMISGGTRCSVSTTWTPSAWGNQVKNRLAKPYGAP